MGASKLLPFCDEGSNFLSDSAYATEPQRRTGNAPGKARSALVNKVLRQTSLMTAAISAFIAVRVAENVEDSMSPEALAALFVEALGVASGIGSATTTAEGKVELATNSETQNGVAVPGHPSLVVTPTSLASLTGTTARRGLVELALESEVIAGTDNQRVITPLGLSARTATEGRRGIVEMATTAEAAAMSDTERAVTPAGLGAALGLASDFSGTDGYAKLPGGLIVQWGTIADSTGPPDGVFPLTFPTACFGVQMIADDDADIGVPTISTTGFTIASPPGRLLRWFAYGH